jgi:S-layer protein
MAFPPSSPLDFVEEDYIGFYNRAGDAPGANFWVNQLNTNNTALGVAVGFAVSSESTAIYPYLASPQVLDPTTYITQIYTNVLGRAPDAPGLAFWQAELTRLNTLYTGPNNTVINLPAGTKLPNANVDPKVVAAAELLTEMLQSVNMQSGTADAMLMANRVTVAEDYTTRTGNAGVTYSQASSHAVILATTSDPTTVATAEAITTNYITNGTNAVFTLTTAVDAPGTGAFATASITGNNNAIFGTVGGAAATYTPGDQIIGVVGSVNNVLNLTDGNSGGNTNITGVAATVSNISNLVVNSGEAVTVNTVTSTAGFTGLTSLTVTSATPNGAAADNITAAATTNITVTDNATKSFTSGTNFLTVNGGNVVTVTETNTDNGVSATMAGISIGATTAAAGAVSVTDTATLTGNSNSGSITVKGAAGVTVNRTVNAGASSTQGAITVTAGAAAIVINDTENNTSLTGATISAGLVNNITTNGGSTVAVTQAVSTTQSATVVSNIVESQVLVNGGAATTTVTLTQAAQATGALAVAAVAAVTGVNPVAAVAAGPGVTGVAAVAGVNGGTTVPAAAATAGSATVFDALITINDLNKATATTASNTITSVTLNNFAAGAIINDNALTSLSLSGTGSIVQLTNAAVGAGLTNTTLALSTTGTSAGTQLSDVNNEITTITETNSGSSSLAITDTALKALNVSGSGVLSLTGLSNPATLTTLTVAGTAGLKGDISATGVTAFAPTSSGAFTLTMNDTTQSFTGSTGMDIISLAGDATKAITGGSGTTDEVVLTSATAAYTAGKFGTNVTGFEILGVADGNSATNTYDMHNIFKGYTGLDLQASNDTTTFTGVTAGTTLGIDANEAAVSYVLFTPSNTSTVSVSLGLASNAGNINVGTLTLTDSNADGVATANIISNAKSATSGVFNSISTFADPSLSALSISGNGALGIGNTIVLGQPGLAVPVGVAALTINNTSAAFNNVTSSLVGSTIFGIQDDTLGSLTFGGTNGIAITNVVDNNATNLTITSTDAVPVSIGTLSTDAQATTVIHNGLSNLTFAGSGVVNVTNEVLVANAAALVITNSGTATDSIVSITDGTSLLTTPSVTISGNVALGANGATIGADAAGAVAFAKTSGFTFSAATDNAHISINLTGATATNTDTITVGNGNDYIKDGSTAGLVNITVGTGQNFIDLHGGVPANTYLANVTLGAHTAPDWVWANSVFAGATSANTIVTGAAAGDFVTVFDTPTAVVALSSGTLTTISNASNLAQAISIADTGLAAHGATAFTFAGNTYVLETAAAGNGTLTNSDSVVELVGVHTLSSTITAAGANPYHLTLLT